MSREKRLFNVYVLGNPLVKEDSLPIKLLPRLKKSFKGINFLELDPTENLPEEEHFIILDTIINTNKVVTLKDIDRIEPQPNYSLHDFDLAFNLKLLKKLKKIKDVTIIGIPPTTNQNYVLSEVKKIISSLLSGNV